MSLADFFFLSLLPEYPDLRLFAEYLGLETMLSIVCKSYEGIKALELYDGEGLVNKGSGIHGLGASIGRGLQGRFLVICLDTLRHDLKTLHCEWSFCFQCPNVSFSADHMLGTL